jgi:hypothetical protein
MDPIEYLDKPVPEDPRTVAWRRRITVAQEWAQDKRTRQPVRSSGQDMARYTAEVRERLAAARREWEELHPMLALSRQGVKVKREGMA